ncbi:MAG: hypothetical protein ACN6PR_02685 [Achromobacter sp.]
MSLTTRSEAALEPVLEGELDDPGRIEAHPETSATSKSATPHRLSV